MKYEFTEEFIFNEHGTKLYRIKALRDFGDISKGDLGGFIEKESNLSHSDDAWVSDYAWVYGKARVFGDAWVYGKARVFGDAWVFGNAMVTDYGWVSDYAWVFGDAGVSDDVRGN